jgi:hypothetical protein
LSKNFSSLPAAKNAIVFAGKARTRASAVMGHHDGFFGQKNGVRPRESFGKKS